jgi:subtilisin family serine protease
MKLSSFSLSLILLTSLVLTFPTVSSARDKYIPGEILVKVKPGKEVDFEKTVKKHDLKTKKIIKEIGYRLIKPQGKMTADEALEKFKADPSIAYAGLNHTLHVTADPLQKWPNDPVFFYGDELLGVPQWGLNNDGSNQGWAGKLRADIHAPEAWYITTGSPSIIIGNLDTGVDYTHEDLLGKVLTGYNAIDGTSDTMDYHSHGTFTAGITAASSDNWTGIAGVAWNCPILPVKVIGDDGM